MNKFMCERCRNAWINLGDPVSSCPVCGTMNRAQPAPTTYWICAGCEARYRTETAASFSRCPKCGHRNEDIDQENLRLK